MATATHQLVSLCERHGLQRDSVDVEKGVIKGVLAVGLKSRNTGRTLGLARAEFGDAIDHPYEYSPDALHEATPLYEGIVVRVDHPALSRGPDGDRRPESQRVVRDVFGELRNVHFVESRGLVADFHYLTTHDLAPRLIEVATRMPDKLSFSHSARGIPEVVSGRIVISSIPEVESVDLIGDTPGTTRGLFESEEKPVKKRTIKQICESATDNVIAARLIEMGMVSDEEIAVEEMDEAGQVEAALESILVGILRGEGTSDEKLNKIKTALKFQDEMTGAGGEETAATPEMEGGEEEDEAKEVEERFNKIESKIDSLSKLLEKFTPQRPAATGSRRIAESRDSGSYDDQAKAFFKKGA